MKFQTNGRVTLAAVTGLASPDIIAGFFDKIGPVLEGLVRMGQISVAVFTCLYIYRRWKTVPKGRNKKKIINEKTLKSRTIVRPVTDGV